MDKIKEFNQKVKIGEIKTIYTSCICSSNDFKKFFNEDRYGLWHPVVACKKCGLVQANPRLTEKEFVKFYSSDLYRKIYDGDKFLDIGSARYENQNEIYKKLEPLMIKRDCKKIIEFGCGGGWNLIEFKRNNYEVTGYDFSYELTKLGKDKYNLNLHQGSFDQIEKERNYDVLVLNHVIEHFTDLEKNLKSLLKVLKSDGLIYIGVPTIDLVTRGQLQNAHTLYFTERTLCHYMKKFGLNLIEFGKADNVHIYGIFDLSESEVNTENISLENEYSIIRKTLMLGAMKIRLAKFLNHLGLLQLIKKIIK